MKKAFFTCVCSLFCFLYILREKFLHYLYWQFGYSNDHNVFIIVFHRHDQLFHFQNFLHHLKVHHRFCHLMKYLMVRQKRLGNHSIFLLVHQNYLQLIFLTLTVVLYQLHFYNPSLIILLCSWYVSTTPFVVFLVTLFSAYMSVAQPLSFPLNSLSLTLLLQNLMVGTLLPSFFVNLNAS